MRVKAGIGARGHQPHPNTSTNRPPKSSFRRRPESRGAVGGKTAASLATYPGLRSGIRGTSQTDESRSFRSSTICYPCARSVPAISSPLGRGLGEGQSGNRGSRQQRRSNTSTDERTQFSYLGVPASLESPALVMPAPNRHSGEGRNPEGRWEARPPPVLARKHVPDSDPGYVAPVKLMSPGRSDLLPSVTHVPGPYRRSPSPVGRGLG